jgi:hypothetical protein
MNQLDTIDRLMALEPPLYLFGGFAEDAVLYGRVSRPHEDIDLLVWLDELPLRIEQAPDLGFAGFEVRFESAPGRPLAVGTVSNGLALEFCVADRTTEGRPFFDAPAPSGLRRVWLPEGMFEPDAKMLDGIRVRTVSPLALYQIRAALAETFGGFRPKDRVVQAALRSRFFPDASDGELAPRVEELS